MVGFEDVFTGRFAFDGRVWGEVSTRGEAVDFACRAAVGQGRYRAEQLQKKLMRPLFTAIFDRGEAFGTGHAAQWGLDDGDVRDVRSAAGLGWGRRLDRSLLVPVARAAFVLAPAAAAAHSAVRDMMPYARQAEAAKLGALQLTREQEGRMRPRLVTRVLQVVAEELRADPSLLGRPDALSDAFAQGVRRICGLPGLLSDKTRVATFAEHGFLEGRRADGSPLGLEARTDLLEAAGALIGRGAVRALSARHRIDPGLGEELAGEALVSLARQAALGKHVSVATARAKFRDHNADHWRDVSARGVDLVSKDAQDALELSRMEDSRAAESDAAEAAADQAALRIAEVMDTAVGLAVRDYEGHVAEALEAAADLVRDGLLEATCREAGVELSAGGRNFRRVLLALVADGWNRAAEARHREGRQDAAEDRRSPGQLGHLAVGYMLAAAARPRR